MSNITWERRHEAFKAIWEKLTDILTKLDQPTDPQTVEIIKSIILGTLGRNLGNLVNGYFENDFEGWDGVYNAEISTDYNYPENPKVGTKSCKLKSTGAYVTQIFTPAVYSNKLKSITFAIKASGSGRTVRFQFFYQDGSISYSDFQTGSAAWEVKTARPQADKYIVAIQIKYYSGFGATYLDFINFNLDPTTLPKLQDLTWFGVQPAQNPPAGTNIYSYTPSGTLHIYGLKLMTEDATMNIAEIYIDGSLADMWLWWREQTQILIFQSKFYTVGSGVTFQIRNQNAGTGWYIADILGEEV